MNIQDIAGYGGFKPGYGDEQQYGGNKDYAAVFAAFAGAMYGAVRAQYDVANAVRDGAAAMPYNSKASAGVPGKQYKIPGTQMPGQYAGALQECPNCGFHLGQEGKHLDDLVGKNLYRGAPETGKTYKAGVSKTGGNYRA